MERFVDLIHDKKNGKELSDESIRDMIEGLQRVTFRIIRCLPC